MRFILAVLCVVVCGRIQGQVSFLRGDANRDCKLEIADAIFTLNYSFLGGAAPQCMDAADTDDDGAITIGDAVRTLSYLFLGLSAPAAPFPEIGPDTTADGLGCHESSLALQFAKDPALAGSNQHVEIFPSSSLEFSAGFTFTAWLWLEQVFERSEIFIRSQSNEQTLDVSIRAVDGQGPRVKFVATPNVPGTPRFLSTSIIPVGAWTHIACTYGNGKARILINGTIDSTMDVQGNINVPGVTAFIGRFQSLAGLVGELDEISLWTYALAEDDIGLLMRGLEGTEEGLVAYYKCDEGQGPNILDLSHHGNHGRLGITAAADVEDPSWVSGKNASGRP